MAIQIKVVDYVILVVVMAVTGLIGVYYTITGRGKETTETLIFGNKRMHYIALALSLVASQTAKISGVPSGIYIVGFSYDVLKVIGRMCCFTIMAFVHLPVYHRLQLTTIYQYLEIRFQKKFLRIIGSIAFLIQTASFLAVSLSAPGQVWSPVVDFDIWGSAISIAIVCTLYTALGGFKAVIATDVFQGGIMIIGMLAILIAGTIEEGGLNRMWEIATEGRRTFNFQYNGNFNPDPRQILTVWNIPGAFTFYWLSISVADQVVLQRGLSASSLRNSQKAFLLGGLIFTFWTMVLALLGLVLYSQYHDCDPQKIGIFRSYKGFLPTYTARVLGNGFPGVLLSVSFCAALSTFSSGVNSMAAVTLTDILLEIPRLSRHIAGKREALCMQLLVLGYGVFIMIYVVVIFNVPLLDKIAYEVSEWTLTSLVGIITLGILSKNVNWKGCLAGWIVGTLFKMWIFIGKIVVNPDQLYLKLPPTTTTDCLGNFTATSARGPISDSRNVFYELYRITYYGERMYTVLVAMLTGVIVSYFTGGEDQEKLDPKSLINYREVFCPCRYKINPEEDVPNETQQKPADDVSQDTGKLTKISGGSKLTKSSGRRQNKTSVKNTGENTEQWKQNHDVVDEDNIKPLEKKDSGLTRLLSNEAIDQTETLHESPNLEETDVAEKSSGGAITA